MDNDLKKITYRQLSEESLSSITNEQLADIASLIYQTDEYIYPAMFECEENAKAVIPEMIKCQDPMFRLNNIFVAEFYPKIVGLILWHKGSLNWNKNIYEKSCRLKCINLSKYIGRVEDEYFHSYAGVRDDEIAIINVCVNEKLRNIGIGKGLIDAFLKEHFETDYFELYVLKENEAAISLYKNKGFILDRTIQGFSVDKRDLPCYVMSKKSG